MSKTGYYNWQFQFTLSKYQLKSLVNAIRKEKGITQVHLAHSIGKDQQSIQRLEAGNINPSFFYLNEIADGLNVDLEKLIRTV